jgi:hypothetical protein
LIATLTERALAIANQRCAAVYRAGCGLTCPVRREENARALEVVRARRLTVIDRLPENERDAALAACGRETDS